MKTKEIRLNGRKYVLTPEEIHKINLIRRGLRLQERMEPLKNELREIKDELGGLAVARKGGKRMIRLDGIIVEAVVTWKKDIALDPEKTAELKEKLGTREFSLFFEERTEYKPTKELNLLTKTKDHKEDQKKLAIINALTIRENGPYVELKHKPLT